MPIVDLHGLVYIIGKSKFVRVRPVLWIFVKKSKMVQVTDTHVGFVGCESPLLGGTVKGTTGTTRMNASATVNESLI